MTTGETPKRSRRAARIGWSLLILVLVAGGAGGTLWFRSGRKESPGANAPVFVARRGPLTIAVTEAGTIQNREKVIIKSQVEGTTTILWLIAEGSYVKKGDKLVELDASRLTDSQTTQEINVQNADAAFVRARENLAVVRNQAEADISKAQLELQFAGEDVERYQKGDYPQQLKEADSTITIAEEELKRSKETLKWSEDLAAEKFLSRTELEADQLDEKKAELQVELAHSRRDLLVKWTYPRQLAQMRSDLEQARLALDRVKRKASADIVQAEADLKAKELQFKREREKLDKIKEQIAKCVIVAPLDGMVIYATTGRGGFRGNEEPLAEGQQVRERQELIHLPTATDMTAEVKVHESSLDLIRKGMPARITVDALPGQVYEGYVAKIGLLPDAQMAWLNPDLKVYSTDVYIKSNGRELRAGMTCRVQIIVKQYDDVVYVPVQSVLRVEGRPTVFVVTPAGIQPRAVTMGLDDNRMVAITDGLQAGESVLLNPPLSAAAAAPLEGSSEQGGHSKGGEGAATDKAVQAQKTAGEPAKEAPAKEPADGKAEPEAREPTEKQPPPSDEAALAALRKKLEGMSRDERRQWIESLPEEERARTMELMRKLWQGGRPGQGGPGGRSGQGGPGERPKEPQ